MATTEFVPLVLNVVDADCEDDSSQALAIDVISSSTFSTCSDDKRFLDTLKEHLASNSMCEALCLRIVVAYHIFGRCEFVTDSIWWLAIKRWKSKQQSKKCANVMDVYLAGFKWLKLNGLNASEYLKSSQKYIQARKVFEESVRN